MTDNDKQRSSAAPRRKRGASKAKAAGGNAGSARVPGDAQRDPVPAAPHAHAAEAKPGRALATIPLHVRWRDLDAFNHVNNSSYLTYLEESRLQWLRGVPGEWFNEHSMPVMAAVELHYRKPITWPTEIDVLLSCQRLGTSSMTIGNRIVDRNDPGCVYADGHIVMVWIDPGNGAPVPLPAAIREAVS